MKSTIQSGRDIRMMNIGDEMWTPSGVRMRVGAVHAGSLNWLFLPGGPGLGSESLTSLVESIAVPGTSWLVDLPGDGSNTDIAAVGANPYDRWPEVLVEAAQAVDNAVFAGHSTGGMYLLSVPEIEAHLVGLALVSSAPDATWLPAFVTMTEESPLPEVEAATSRFEADPTNEHLGAIAVASAPWNFGPDHVAEGVALLARMPYNMAATNWSSLHFDATYASTWWPAQLPTLIVSGGSDRIVAQSGWEATRFQGDHIIRHTVQNAEHFPWIERPEAVRRAFAALSDAILNGLASGRDREEEAQ